MVKFWKHIFWGLIVPTIGVTFVVYGARFGIIFWPKYEYASEYTMQFVGIILVSTFLLGSIYKYCDVVNGMEI